MTLTFNQNVTSATASADVLKIFGSQTGYLSNKGSYAQSNSTATFGPPAVGYRAGEQIFVTVTNAQTTGFVSTTKSTVHSFWAAAANTGGNFNHVQSTVVGATGVPNIVLADVNNDGNLDLITALLNFNNTLTNNVQIRLGAGNGSFPSVTNQYTERACGPVITEDMNNDGNVDLLIPITTNGGSDNQVVILSGNGAGAFTRTQITVASAGAGSYYVKAADMNGDGLLDIIATNSDASTITVLLNTGSNTFASPRSIAYNSDPHNGAFIPAPPGFFDIGDINNDGNLDVFVVGINFLTVGFGDGRGGLTLQPTLFGGDSFGNGPQPYLLDLNNDGNLDFLCPFGPLNRVTIGIGNGTGSFTVSYFNYGSFYTNPNDLNPFILGIGDLDGDGDFDFLMPHNSGQTGNMVTRVLNNGSGTFTTSGTFTVPIPNGFTDNYLFGRCVVGDLNGDGTIDAVFPTTLYPNGTENGMQQGGFASFLNQSGAFPIITSVSPSSGATGSTITITGTNLNQLTAVRFFGSGGINATINSNTPTEVVVTVPTGISTPTGQIYVQNATGNTLSGMFTVLSTSLTVSSPSLNFGSTTANSASTSQTIGIIFTNLGINERVSYDLGGTNSSNFSLSSSGFSTNASQTVFTTNVTISFTPGSGIGTSVATLTIGLASTTATAVVNLTASVIAPTPVTTVTVNVSTLNFGTSTASGGTTTQTVNITFGNIANGERVTYALGGTNSANFTANTSGFSTNATQTTFSTSVTVTFTPGSGVGTSVATLTIGLAGTTATTVVNLTANVIAPTPATTVTVNVSMLNFGNQNIGATGTQTVVLTIANVQAGERFSYSVSGTQASEFSIGNNFGFTTSATSTQFSTSITLSFTAGGVGTRSATLAIAVGGAPNAGTTVGLSGIGVALPQPSITSLSAVSAQRGESITITGTNLSNATAVRFFGANGVDATIQSNTATQLVVTVPNIVGSGAIFVQTTINSANSSTFTINAQPVVQTVPATLVAGQSATLGGLNLDLVSSVSIGGVSASITSQTRTSLVLGVPATLSSSGLQSLVVSGTTGTATANVNVIAIPTVTALSATSAGVGSTITLTGTNLNQLTAVRFFGANGTLASIVSSSATQVVVTVPSGASALQGQIFVQNPAGSALSGNFTVILLPTITGITPLVTTTGQTITITGTNLADITAVRFFGASGVAGIIQSQNATQVVVAVPAGITAISGTITVVNAGGSIASVEELAIVARPVITGLSSTQIALGGQITLNGANLDRITEVRFFGSSGATGTIVSQTPTQLVATAPMQLSLRSGSIFLRNIAGTAESQTVIVVAQPTITGASPLPTYAGQTLTIAGTNFTGVNSVRFFGTNGVTANIVSLTDTQATVIVPSGSAQLGQIVMSNVAGSGFSEAITLLQPPSITTVPESATAGSEITIVGSNFDALRSVRFFGTNGVSGTILSSSATQIRVRIPTEGITTASGQIAVENAVGIGLSSTQTRLLSAPIISRVLVGGTTRTLVQEGETITVIGENFDQVTTVRIFGQNGTSVDFNRQGSTTIQFAMPTGSYGQSGQVALTNAIGTGLTTILTVGRPPTITAVQPSTFEPGQDVTIAGTDLQFVTTIRFFGATGTTATIRSRASDNRSITVTVPLGRGAGRVFAENILGSGQSTSDVAYRVFAPGVPTAVNVGSITSSSATLTFSTPSTGSDPAQFEVRIAPNATIAPSTILFSATTRTYTVQLTNLGAGSSYKVEVRAVNTAGSSPWVSADFTTQLAPGPVNVPTNLRITQADANSASLAWNPPTGGGSPVRYTLQWRWVIDENIANASPTSGAFSTLQVDRFNNTARVTNLNFAQNVSVLVANVRQTRSVRVRYEFSVRAENAISVSAFTPVVIQRVPAEPPPSPTTLTARDITSSSFIAQANVVGSQLSSVTWELFSSENNFAQPIQSITNPQTSSGQIRQTFTGIRFGVNYYFTVVARNIGGPSAVARLTPNFTALPSTPGTPQLLNATSIGATGFVANWLAVGGTGGAPDGFEIQRATGTQAIDNATIVNVANKDARNFTFENLGPDLVQRWRIRAYNNNRSGFSAWSDVVTTNLIDLRRLDSVALTRIFTDGGGANWTNRTGWNTTSRMDQWYGVTIENNRVVALRLGNNNVRAISPAIRQLAFLRTLSLWGNTLTTLPVDSLAVLTRLQRLELDYNQITAFNVNLSALTNLRFLRLNNNNISSLGTSVFTASSALRVVRLDNNALTGPVPQQIFNLNDLRVLNMANNGLTSFAGNVAKWNGSLTHISLNRNAFTTLPNFTGASGLMQFNIAQNRLSASALQVNVSLDNIARVTYVATPQTTVVAGQSALLSDMSDMLTPNASSTDVNSPQEFRVIERKAEIYPNPARDEAIVSFPVEEEGAIHIMITDVLGRIVYNEHLLPLIQPIMSGNTRILHATIRLDVRVFTAGRYSIAIRQKNPTAQTLRSSFMIIR